MNTSQAILTTPPDFQDLISFASPSSALSLTNPVLTFDHTIHSVSPSSDSPNPAPTSDPPSSPPSSSPTQPSTTSPEPPSTIPQTSQTPTPTFTPTSGTPTPTTSPVLSTSSSSPSAPSSDRTTSSSQPTTYSSPPPVFTTSTTSNPHSHSTPSPSPSSSPPQTTYVSTRIITTNVVTTRISTYLTQYLTTSPSGGVETVTAAIPFTQITSFQTVTAQATTLVTNANLNGSDNDHSSSGFFANTGAVAGLFVVLGLGALAGLVAGALLLFKRRKRKFIQRAFEDELQLANDDFDDEIYRDGPSEMSGPSANRFAPISALRLLPTQHTDEQKPLDPDDLYNYGTHHSLSPGFSTTDVGHHPPHKTSLSWSQAGIAQVSHHLLAGYQSPDPSSPSDPAAPPHTHDPHSTSHARTNSDTPNTSLLTGYHDHLNSAHRLTMSDASAYSPAALNFAPSTGQHSGGHSFDHTESILHPLNRRTMTPDAMNRYMAANEPLNAFEDCDEFDGRMPRQPSEQALNQSDLPGDNPPSTVFDDRLEPSVLLGYKQRTVEEQSLRDETDYSRRILKVSNPDEE